MKKKKEIKPIFITNQFNWNFTIAGDQELNIDKLEGCLTHLTLRDMLDYVIEIEGRDGIEIDTEEALVRGSIIRNNKAKQIDENGQFGVVRDFTIKTTKGFDDSIENFISNHSG